MASREPHQLENYSLKWGALLDEIPSKPLPRNCYSDSLSQSRLGKHHPECIGSRLDPHHYPVKNHEERASDPASKTTATGTLKLPHLKMPWSGSEQPTGPQTSFEQGGLLRMRCVDVEFCS